MRKGIVLLGFLMVFALTGGTASAAAIAVDGSWYEFGFGAPPGAAGSCASIGGCVPGSNPASVDAGAPPWTFSGAATITLLDLFLSVDQFELFDNLVSVGVSSAPVAGGGCGSDITCSLADARYSRLVVNLGAGNHSLTINNLVGQGGAAVFRAAAPVPEPTSMLLLGSGLAGVAAKIRRRRKAAKA